MACFLVPLSEGIVISAAKASVSKKNPEKKRSIFFEKLGWLNKMLLGGSFLLAFEHIWHGEVVPWFPFLTAASDKAATKEMLHEMATSGVAMLVTINVVWIIMVLAYQSISKKSTMAFAKEEQR